MLHLPIIENRIAQFAARFSPHGDGWVYHGDGITGGLPLSDAEHAALIDEHARRLRLTARVLLWWLIVAVIGLAAYEIAMDLRGDLATRGIVLLLPLPWVFWTWYRADRLATEQLGRRTAVTPPRTRSEAVQSRVAALPPSIAIMLLIICGLLAWRTWPWASSSQRWGLAEAIGGMIFAGWLLWTRHRAGQR